MADAVAAAHHRDLVVEAVDGGSSAGSVRSQRSVQSPTGRKPRRSRRSVAAAVQEEPQLRLGLDLPDLSGCVGEAETGLLQQPGVVVELEVVLPGDDRDRLAGLLERDGAHAVARVAVGALVLERHRDVVELGAAPDEQAALEATLAAGPHAPGAVAVTRDALDPVRRPVDRDLAVPAPGLEQIDVVVHQPVVLAQHGERHSNGLARALKVRSNSMPLSFGYTSDASRAAARGSRS